MNLEVWLNLIWILELFLLDTDVVASENSAENVLYVGFAHQPQDAVVVTSKPFILHCEINKYSNSTSAKNSIPPSNVFITWYKDGQQIDFNKNLSIHQRRTLLQNGSLYISSAVHNSVHDSDSGVYHCKARYSEKVLISSTARVIVAVFSFSHHSPLSVSACVSSLVNLNCNFTGADPSPIISWYKGDRLIGSNTDVDSIQFHSLPPSINVVDRYVFLSNGAIQIMNSRDSDSGTYHCTGKNPAGVVQGTRYVLNVTAFDKKCSSVSQFVSIPVSTIVIVGQTAYLNCAVDRFSTGLVKWLRNGVEIIFRNRSRFKLFGQANLMIERAQLADTAQYSCVFEGQIPRVASAYLTVQEPPRLLSEPNHLQHGHIGCQISFPCLVAGTPKPVLTWYKDGKALVESNITKFQDATLLVIITSKEDSGIYQCFAQNQVGQIQASYQLQIFDQVSESGITLTNDTIYLESLTSRSASLVWSPFRLLSPSGYTVNIFDSTANSRASLESKKPSCEISDLEENHTMHVTVTPYTNLCTAFPSKEITFTIPIMDDRSNDMIRNFVVEPSATSVLIKWLPPAGREADVLYYQVRMEQLSDKASGVESVNTANTYQDFVGLQAYTTYRFQVAVVNPSGEPGPFTRAIETKTLQSDPSRPPLGITATVESSDSVMVKWSPPPLESVNGPISGYTIKYKGTNSRKIDVVHPLAEDTQFRLKDLRKNTRYWLRMQVSNNVSSSPLSAKINFKTLKKEKMEKFRPGPPKLMDPKISARDIILMWGSPDDGVVVREYVIGWGESGPYEQTARASNDAHFFRITGLEPYTQYFISVRAKNNVGMGQEYHTELWTKSLEDTPKELYPPLGVHVTVLTHTTLNVSWHDADRYRQDRYYLVRYKTKYLPKVGYVNSSDVTCIIPGLRPHTVYEIAVRVVQGNIKSMWSMTETATTKESPPGSAPTDLTVMPFPKKPTFVQINWQPPVEPNGELDGYLIFYTTDDTNDIKDWVIEPVVGDKLSTTIEGLTEDTQYYFKALARNKQGVGPCSKVVSYRTSNLVQPSRKHKSPPKSMPNWMLYIIIGAVALLVISIITVSTIMICRSRKTKTKKSSPKRQPINGGPHFPVSGIRSPSGESYSAPSGKSMNICHCDDQVEMQPLQTPNGRYGTDFSRCCPNANHSEMSPLNGSNCLANYPYIHSQHHGDVMRSQMSSDSCQCCTVKGPYRNVNSVQLPNFTPLECDAQYDDDYRSPYSTVNQAGQQDYAVDSAYGSDHQHHHAMEDNLRAERVPLKRHKLQDDSSDRIPSSDSLSSTTSSDDQISSADSNIANVTDFLRVMNSTDDVASPAVHS